MRLLSFVSNGISRVHNKLERAIDKITAPEEVEEIAGVRERNRVHEIAEHPLNSLVPDSSIPGPDQSLVPNSGSVSMESSLREFTARSRTLETIEEVDSEFERSSILSSLRSSVSSASSGTESTISSTNRSSGPS